MHQGLAFQYEFNRGGFSYKEVRMPLPLSERNRLSAFLASARVSGWQLVTKAMTALAILL